MENEQRVKQEVQKQFGANAGKYVTSESHAKGEDLQLLVEWLNPQPHWHCLDIATGGGHVVKALAPYVRHLLATDLTREMLQAAAQHLRQSGCDNVGYVVADAESLPFLDDAFDVVTCRIAPHHFPRPDRFIREASRVLRAGGMFLLIDNVSPEDGELAAFLNTMEKLRDGSHVRCPAVSEWRAWLDEAGLQEKRSRLRKKTYAFPEWVARTARSPEQRKQVEEWILNAPPQTRAYFAVRTEAGKVVSLQVDEWMILLERR
ncbi:methyltransferase domain-containing protein [Brevibacillus sp. SYP-B805]|uniref:class I SAM-dependent methyltransferase n=1 Tax=Brevibacillus sp. SYP-B805 TaxID=1578199 RepID=UPI0013EE2342|nr:class I SAM-dependent methyltransferase [Brevibacillus sp. SYP-B805]NGQ94690.1 methyltransferase domain-containing protein [Brevibacillus sp. SYP-B805]